MITTSWDLKTCLKIDYQCKSSSLTETMIGEDLWRQGSFWMRTLNSNMLNVIWWLRKWIMMGLRSSSHMNNLWIYRRSQKRELMRTNTNIRNLIQKTKLNQKRYKKTKTNSKSIAKKALINWRLINKFQTKVIWEN